MSNNLIVKSSATVARSPEIHYNPSITSWLKHMNYIVKFYFLQLIAYTILFNKKELGIYKHVDTWI